jgi:hypothetical protein
MMPTIQYQSADFSVCMYSGAVHERFIKVLIVYFLEYGYFAGAKFLNSRAVALAKPLKNTQFRLL